MKLSGDGNISTIDISLLGGFGSSGTAVVPLQNAVTAGNSSWQLDLNIVESGTERCKWVPGRAIFKAQQVLIETFLSGQFIG